MNENKNNFHLFFISTKCAYETFFMINVIKLV